MESTIGYIVIIGLVIISVALYNIRKKKLKIYLLSNQQYPELSLAINIKKEQGDIEAILINIIALKKVELTEIKVELISSKREFNFYSLNTVFDNLKLPMKVEKSENSSFQIPFKDFKSLLVEGEHPFRTFRFVVVGNDKVFKSHELGFNKKWVIYRPDSGNYN